MALLFDTDHYMVKMTLRYPTTHKKLYIPITKAKRSLCKPDVSFLVQNKESIKTYDEHLDSSLDPNNIPNDLG